MYNGYYMRATEMYSVMSCPVALTSCVSFDVRVLSDVQDSLRKDLLQ